MPTLSFSSMVCRSTYIFFQQIHLLDGLNATPLCCSSHVFRGLSFRISVRGFHQRLTPICGTLHYQLLDSARYWKEGSCLTQYLSLIYGFLIMHHDPVFIEAVLFLRDSRLVCMACSVIEIMFCGILAETPSLRGPRTLLVLRVE